MEALSIIHAIVTLLSAAAIGWAAKEIIAHGKELYHLSESCKFHKPVVEERMKALEQFRRDYELQGTAMLADIKYIRAQLDTLLNQVNEANKIPRKWRNGSDDTK